MYTMYIYMMLCCFLTPINLIIFLLAVVTKIQITYQDAAFGRFRDLTNESRGILFDQWDVARWVSVGQPLILSY